MNRYELTQLVAAAIEDAEANDARYEDLAIAAINVVLEEAAKIAELAAERDALALGEASNAEERAAFERGVFKARNVAFTIRTLKVGQ